MDLRKIGPAVRVDDAEIDVAIDIDLQKVEEDSVMQMKPGSNDAEMDDAAHKVVAQRRAMRPKATSKGYRKGLSAGLPSARGASLQTQSLFMRRRFFFSLRKMC
jgi:hypothetical protein